MASKKNAPEETYGPTMEEAGELFADDIADPGVPVEVMASAVDEVMQQPRTIHNEGHTYKDHPSTLCVKRMLGRTEIMWTFRGDDDMATFNRALNMVKLMNEQEEKMKPQQQAEAQVGQPATPGWCSIHNVQMLPSKDGNGFFHKAADHPTDKDAQGRPKAVWCRGS